MVFTHVMMMSFPTPREVLPGMNMWYSVARLGRLMTALDFAPRRGWRASKGERRREGVGHTLLPYPTPILRHRHLVRHHVRVRE